MYTLRFPFTLPEGREIAVSRETYSLDGLTFTLNKEGRHYVITVTGFLTKDAAERYINNIWAGLMWLLLHRGLPPDARWQPQKVAFVKDSHKAGQNLSKGPRHIIEGPVDGVIDGGWPAVYPTDKNIRKVWVGSATFRLTTTADHVIEFFSEGVAFSESSQVVDDAKLRVALELYGAHFTEISANAKFLALIMALESLATGTRRTQFVLALQKKWIKEVDELQKTVDQKSADAVSLETLRNDLRSRRENSLGSQILTLVRTTLENNGDKDADEMASVAMQVYRHRGTLVHEGKLEPRVLDQATSDARNLVQRVLKARFLRQCQ